MCWVGALPCTAEELAIKVPLGSFLPETVSKRQVSKRTFGQRGRGHADEHGKADHFSLTLLVTFINYPCSSNQLKRKKSKGDNLWFPTGGNGPFYVANNTQTLNSATWKSVTVNKAVDRPAVISPTCLFCLLCHCFTVPFLSTCCSAGLLKNSAGARTRAPEYRITWAFTAFRESS